MGFLAYISLSVYLDGAEIVGSFGRVVADNAFALFGYVVYVLPVPVFYLLYRLYKDFSYSQRKVEIAAASLLILVATLIFQDVVTDYKISIIGSAFVDVFFPIIGTVGIVIIILALLAISALIILDATAEELSYYLSRLIGRKVEKPKSQTVTPKEELPAKRVVISGFEEEGSEEEASAPTSVESDHSREENADAASFERDHAIDAKEEVTTYLQEKMDSLGMEDESILEELALSRHRYIQLTESAPEEKPLTPEQEPDVSPEEREKLEAELAEIETIERLVDSIGNQYDKAQQAQALLNRQEEPAEQPDEKREEPDAGEAEAKRSEVTIVKELEENKKLLDDIEVGGKKTAPKNFVLPKLGFLAEPKEASKVVNEAEIDAKIEDLLEKLKMFKIEGDVVRTYSGPVVTTFEFKPAPHIKVSKILNLQDDIAMALKALTIRIQAPIPGKDVVGIEIPNENVETIYLRDVLESDIFNKAASPLTIALGKDIVGNPFVTDLKKLPHLLIAGTTGSGKSVGINAMILSLLYRNTPDELKLLMVDPKMLEFSIYNDIPHLLTPVITKPKQAIAALANMVREMERRYYLMSQTRTKNIENYNEKALKEKFTPFPYIVVIIDELADLMMTGGKEVEVSIARLAQMARASGIHLIVATQRPSVDVITGLIKANLPSRISYRVGQKIDSKVILDTLGAESLLGRGDMLFTPPGSVGVVRLHAPWSSEQEIEKIVDHLKSQREAEYDHSFLDEGEGGSVSGNGSSGDFDEELDEMYEEAKEVVLTEKKTSISYLQRRLQIGYNRAARIVEQLEKTGVLSEQNAKGQREIVN